MRTIVLVLACLATLPAGAQKRARVKTDAPPPVQKLDFDKGDTVEAGVDLPQAEVVSVAKGSKHESLIRLRTTFVPEMVRDSFRL